MSKPSLFRLPGFCLRCLRLIAHLLVGLLAAIAVNLDFTRRLRPDPIARWWSSRLLRILDLRVTVQGQPARRRGITVANHVSWLDIPLLAAHDHTRFIAKSEIRDWPVAGWLANAAGTFYIRRGKGGAKPLLDRLVPHLRGGGSVVLFPEGTTTDGSQVLAFHPRLFAAAIDAQTLVQPIALRYAHAPDGRPVAPFIGDDDLFGHILRVLRTPGLSAEVVYCTPIDATGLDRDAVARRAHTAVRHALGDAPVQSASGIAPALAA